MENHDAELEAEESAREGGVDAKVFVEGGRSYATYGLEAAKSR